MGKASGEAEISMRRSSGGFDDAASTEQAGGFAGAGASAAGGVTGMPAGTPSADAAVGLTAAPEGAPAAGMPIDVSADGAIGAATEAGGATDTVARVNTTRGDADRIHGVAGDPSGAASAEVDGRVSSEVGARAPVDPSAATSRVENVRGTVADPQAAVSERVHGSADAQVTQSTGVQVQGSADVDPTKK